MDLCIPRPALPNHEPQESTLEGHGLAGAWQVEAITRAVKSDNLASACDALLKDGFAWLLCINK